MSTFDKQFAKARKSGLKEFSFGGKKYNTKLKSEAKGDAPVKKKSSLPKITKATPSARPYMDGSTGAKIAKEQGMAVAGGLSRPYQASEKAKADSVLAQKMIPAAVGFAKQKPEAPRNRSDRNSFRQSESKRASDESFLKHKIVNNI